MSPINALRGGANFQLSHAAQVYTKSYSDAISTRFLIQTADILLTIHLLIMYRPCLSRWRYRSGEVIVILMGNIIIVDALLLLLLFFIVVVVIIAVLVIVLVIGFLIVLVIVFVIELLLFL